MKPALCTFALATFVLTSSASAQDGSLNTAAENPARAHTETGPVLHSTLSGPASPATDPPHPFIVRLTGPDEPAVSAPAGEAALGREATRETVSGRAEALQSVVRLRDARGLVCTATVTRRGHAVGLLTAAHCLYDFARTGEAGRLRRSLAAEGIGPVDPASAFIDRRFRACAEQGSAWRECVDQRAEDLAWLPLSAAPAAVRAWPLCGAEHVPTNEVTIFGYGLNGRLLPRALLQGAFRVIEPRGDRGVHRAYGISGVRVDGGDSGGPVIHASDDQRMGARLPCVQYVAVAVQVGGANDGLGTSAALLQPVYNAAAFAAH